jgi:hypothetical protein
MNNILTLWTICHPFGWIFSQHLTPKGLTTRTADKPVLGSVTWPNFIFRFFEFFCVQASRNKLRMSTNFIIFGPTNQKLWMFEVLKRRLGKAGMWWSQWGGVDQSVQKWGKKEKKRERQPGKNGAPVQEKVATASRRTRPCCNQWMPPVDHCQLGDNDRSPAARCTPPLNYFFDPPLKFCF